MPPLKKMRAFVAVAIFGLSPAVFAYVNPGAGITFLGSLLGFLAGLVFVVLGIFLWPVRRYLQYRRNKQAGQDTRSPREEQTLPDPMEGSQKDSQESSPAPKV